MKFSRARTLAFRSHGLFSSFQARCRLVFGVCIGVAATYGNEASFKNARSFLRFFSRLTDKNIKLGQLIKLRIEVDKL